jgi:hypothetical protein
MQRLLIITTNCALLVILLIGIPAVTRARFGNLHISSVSDARLLTYWGLGIAAAGNFLVATVFAFGRNAKILCFEWTAVFGALILAEYGFVHGYFNFDWLKDSLLWIQKHL